MNMHIHFSHSSIKDLEALLLKLNFACMEITEAKQYLKMLFVGVR